MAAEGHNGESSPSENPTSVDHSLDEVARGLADGTISRGKALGLMGSAFLGAALASVPGVAWAACPTGQTRCGDRCVDLQTNERHCGSCRNRCGSNQTCCKGRCVNLQRSERHCGNCSNRCAEGEECVRGVCQGAGCPSGTTLCGGNCVSNCPSPQTLNTSTCQCECPSGTTLCGGACVSNNCFGGKVINPSTCQCECPAGTTGCAGDTRCVSNDCPPGQVIDPSQCVCDCPGGSTTCISGACVSSTCPAGQVVNPGTCRCETAAAGCSSAWNCRGLAPTCGSSGGQTCVCTASVEGPVVCAGSSCPGRIPCTSSAECETKLGPGAVCQAPITTQQGGVCGCGQACIAPCGSPSATRSISSTGESNIG
jgi:hypothetical protein